jgi:hypothetical protein
METQTALPALVDGQACLCLRILAAEYNMIEDYVPCHNHPNDASLAVAESNT